MGKVGQVFHPEQDRIVSVRECARAQVGLLRIESPACTIMHDRDRLLGRERPSCPPSQGAAAAGAACPQPCAFTQT